PAFDYTNPDAGPDGTLVFQKTPHAGGTSEIWGYVDPTSAIAEQLVTDAASPSISPDGQHLAFVRVDSGFAQIFVSDLHGGSLVQVTKDATDHDNPTWSPDGSTIAFNEGTAVLTVPADGSGATSPRTVTDLTGLPAYRPENVN